MRFSRSIVIVALLVLASAASAQIENPTSWDAKLKQKSAKQGDIVTANVTATIKNGWHIYSTKNYGDDGPLPTTIEITPAKFFSISGSIKAPKPKSKVDEAFQITAEYYEKKVTFAVPVRISAKAPLGKQTLTVTVNAMACDDKMCMPPKSAKFDLPIEIQAGTGQSDVVPPVTPPSTPAAPPAATPAPTSTPTAQAAPAPSQAAAAPAAPEVSHSGGIANIKEKGLLWFIGFAMTMGFLALLTPCVFPMIPLTVSFFTKHAAKNHKRGISDAMLYGGGIVSTFTAVGFVFAMLFGATSLSGLATNPVVNIIFGLIFLLLALNLFGVFELTMPSGLVNKLNARSGLGRGRSSILIMGLTFTLTSFTCTVPFIGTVMVAAARGEYIWPLVGMLAFSSAFALPFVLLAMFPHAIKKMPRGGDWMNGVKIVMGFLELAAVIKFLSNADIIWDWEVLTRDVFLSTWIAIAVVLSLYLLGIVKFQHDASDVRVGTGRLLLSIFFITAALFFYTGINGVPLGTIDAYLPPREYGIKERLNTMPIPKEETSNEVPASRSEARRQAHNSDLEWLDDYNAALALAKKTNKNVFIDFTGFTCTNCRWMESNVFPKPSIDSLLHQFVLVRLYTDGDGANFQANQKMEESRFGTVALPLYAIMSADDKPVAVFDKGMTRDVGEFQGFLQSGLAAMIAAIGG